MKNIKVSNFVTRINEAMGLRNMRSVDLIKRTGIPKSSFSQYINNYVEPKSDRIFLLAQALNVSEAWLLGYDVPMEAKKIISNNVKSDNIDVKLHDIIDICKDLSSEEKDFVLQVLKRLYC